MGPSQRHPRQDGVPGQAVSASCPPDSRNGTLKRVSGKGSSPSSHWLPSRPVGWRGDWWPVRREGSSGAGGCGGPGDLLDARWHDLTPECGVSGQPLVSTLPCLPRSHSLALVSLNLEHFRIFPYHATAPFTFRTTLRRSSAIPFPRCRL